MEFRQNNDTLSYLASAINRLIDITPGFKEHFKLLSRDSVNEIKGIANELVRKLNEIGGKLDKLMDC